jgi:hypothetical protein
MIAAYCELWGYVKGFAKLYVFLWIHSVSWGNSLMLDDEFGAKTIDRNQMKYLRNKNQQNAHFLY